MKRLDVLFTPADFSALSRQDLTQTCCVVTDVLRATSSMVTALGHGAAGILPVSEIVDAMTARERLGDVLLAGEREGVLIGASLTGGKSFDLGNSPREFTASRVSGKTIVMTTTNGTRALSACGHASRVFVASFLNLGATARAIRNCRPSALLVVCSGTFEEAAYEDVLGAGALCHALWDLFPGVQTDSAQIAREIYLNSRKDLMEAMARSRNGRRLLSRPELHDDVAFCLRTDAFPLAAELLKDGLVRRTAER